MSSMPSMRFENTYFTSLKLLEKKPQRFEIRLLSINDNLNMYINDHLRMYTSDYALI